MSRIFCIVEPPGYLNQTAPETTIPVTKLRPKEGHIKIWTVRGANVRYTPDLVCLLTTSCYLCCLFATEPKNLNYSVADTPWTLPLTVLTVQSKKTHFTLFCPEITESSLLNVKLNLWLSPMKNLSVCETRRFLSLQLILRYSTSIRVFSHPSPKWKNRRILRQCDQCSLSLRHGVKILHFLKSGCLR